MAINSPYVPGLLIQQRRKALGLTQAELAKRAMVSRKWINELESGKPNAQLRTVMDVLYHLGWSMEVEDLND
jgi:HTH-type transcriptional regulator / antitoxin HipB